MISGSWGRVRVIKFTRLLILQNFCIIWLGFTYLLGFNTQGWGGGGTRSIHDGGGGGGPTYILWVENYTLGISLGRDLSRIFLGLKKIRVFWVLSASKRFIFGFSLSVNVEQKGR